SNRGFFFLEPCLERYRGTARPGRDGISGSVPDKRQPLRLSDIISGSLFYSTGGGKRPRFEARSSAATCSPKNGLRPAAAGAPRSTPISSRSHGESSARRDAMPMGKPGKNVSTPMSSVVVFGSSGQEECNEICFKDPVLKDHEWSYYIDRSPGHDNYSLVCLKSPTSADTVVSKLMQECFRACISGCGFRVRT
ncbi:hypothetical protein BHE74_00033182, partial [Ensete ventricosum]